MSALRDDLLALLQKEPFLHAVIFTAQPMMQYQVKEMIRPTSFTLFEMDKVDTTPRQRHTRIRKIADRCWPRSPLPARAPRALTLTRTLLASARRRSLTRSIRGSRALAAACLLLFARPCQASSRPLSASSSVQA